jgi:carbamoyltransferase
MIILGYSGINNAYEYRKKNLDGLSNQEANMVQGMDSSAAIIHNGKIVAAAEEERFNLKKHTGDFPINAINFCLDKANVKIDDIDFICHGFDFEAWKSFYELNQFSKGLYDEVLSKEVQIGLFKKNYGISLDKEKFIPVRHHTAHAASGFYPSGFEKSLIIVADGMGEVDSISLYIGEGQHIHSLKHFNLFSSLGIFYSLITAHLGFEINSGEYKTMGLAPYGDPRRFSDFFNKCITLQKGEIIVPVFSKNKTLLEKQTYRALMEWISNETFKARDPEKEIEQIHMDFAAGLQATLNKMMLDFATYWQEKTMLKNLCLAGGVALNCVMNSTLLKSGIFDRVYVPPAAGDSGTSIGAALYKYCQQEDRKFIDKQKLPFYGPSFSKAEILKILNDFKASLQFVELEMEELTKMAAQSIYEGNIIAWFQGCMEFGPRALGNRSILADPRREDMKDRINKAVKKREAFRPFAPVVKFEKASSYFDLESSLELPHMLFTVNVRDKYRNLLPSVTHQDGSARLQTVNKKDHLLFWNLIDDFEKLSNIPVILNTSFNVKGQPIVCSPFDAVNTFLDTEIDALFINNFYVRKLATYTKLRSKYKV